MQNQKLVWGLPLRQQVISLALSGNCLWATLGVSAGVVGAIAQIAPAQAAVLTQWQFNSTTNQLEITVPEGTQPRYFLLAKPARIVLDLPNTQMGAVPTEQTLSGPVQQIRVSQQQAGFTRIVMQLAPNVVFAPGQVKLEPIGTSKTGTRWVLRPLIANSASTPTVAATPTIPATPTTPAPSTAKPQVAAPTPPSVQASESAEPNERSQPPPPAAPPKNRITRNAADLASPADNPVNSASKPSPAIAPPTETPPQPSDTFRPAPAATSDTTVFSPRLSPTVTAATPAPATPVPVRPATIQPPRTAPTRDRPVAVAPPKPPMASIAPQPAPQLPVTPSQPPEVITSVAPAAPAVVSEPQPPVVPVVEEPLETTPALTVVKPTAPAKPVVPPIPATSLVQPLSNPVTSQRDRPTPANASPPQNLSQPTPEPLATQLEPIALPPANFRVQQPVTVSVPPMNRTPAPTQIPQLGDRVPTSATNTEAVPVLPPAVFTPQPSATVTVPSLSSPPIQPAPTRVVTSESPQPSRTPNVDEAGGRVIEFGQPLATASSISNAAPTELDFERPPNPPGNLRPENASLVAVGDGIVLSSGATLQLQYSGAEVLELKPGTPQQEVLLLQTEIRDRNGSILAPVGTPIIGRFETTSGGSRFLAQAISLQGRNVPLSAESGLLGGKLQVSQDKVVRNSALGALAGALVGGSGEEVLGGAAAGAAVTYLASPKPAKLQPGQVLQVRLTEVLRSP